MNKFFSRTNFIALVTGLIVSTLVMQSIGCGPTVGVLEDLQGIKHLDKDQAAPEAGWLIPDELYEKLRDGEPDDGEPEEPEGEGD